VASSISSSDQFPRRERWLPTWLFVVLATAGFAIFVTWSQFSWFFDPTSFRKRIETVQEHAIDSRADARIIILGTSRAAFGLAPSVIETVLGRPALSVANWAYPGFALSAYEPLIAANKDKVAAAELVLVGIDPYFTLRSKEELTPQKEKAPELATLNWAAELDRWIRIRISRVAPISEKMAWFLHEFLGQLGLVQPYRLDWVMLASGNWDHRGSASALLGRDAQVRSEAFAKAYYHDKGVHKPEVTEWNQFLRMLTSLNRQVVLYYLPEHPALSIAEQSYANVIAEGRKAFAELARINGIKLIDITAAECGLADDLFADPVHTSRRGTERLSECFAQRLQREIPRL